MCNGVRGVYYREIQVMRTRLLRSVVASMVSPALFLIAFGYGLGRYQTFGGMDYLDFLFAGLLAMSTLNACYGVGTDINIARFYFKTFDEYLIAPVRRWEVVAGETLYGMTKGLINTVIFFMYAVIAKLSLTLTPAFILILLIHMAVFSLLGFIVALGVKNHGDQFAVNTFLITPMTFLSGVFFPVERAPEVMQWIVQIFPLTRSVNLMRSALSGGRINGWDMLILLGFLIIFFLIALRLAKRTEG